MAILKMKRLRLVMARQQRKELLKKLIKLGCVEFREISEILEDPQYSDSIRSVSAPVIELKQKQATINSAITLINRYVPEKTSLLSSKPEVAGDILLDDSGISTALSRSEKLLEAEETIQRIGAEESRQRGIIDSLQPWLELDMRLEKTSTVSSSILLGTLPAKIDITALNMKGPDEAELFEVSSDKARRYVAAVCHKDSLSEYQEFLRANSFTPASFGDMAGTARDCTNLAKAELNALKKKKEDCFDVINAGTEFRKDLQLASDKIDARIEMALAEEKLLETDNVIFMEGWIPEENEPQLDAVLARFDCAWETEAPDTEEYPEVPVKLKNNFLTNGLNMVTNMYSLPKYGTVDPNPLMAPFFILFFGLMMADMGYGILMIVGALVAMKKMKPRDNTLSFVQLLFWGGIATFAMGILTGSFFSDIPYQLVHIFDPSSTWEGLPYLFSPVYNSELVLYGSMVLGALHLNAGMVVNFVQKVKNGHTADAIWEEGSLWVLLVGGILAFLKIGNIGGIPVVLIAALCMLLFGAGRNSKGFGKVTAAFACIYNTATGWFGDVLSYSRIMALMLAGGVVGQVFNTVATMPMKNGVNVISVLAFVIIFLLGHAMNFGLNLLGCYVHDLRLQCLEFFGKFYEDGGKRFTPLKFGGKYMRAKEN